MAMFEIHTVDEQIKALPIVDTASGSIAAFDTDMTENLVGCVCEVTSGSSEINVSRTGKNIITGKLLNANISSAGKIIVDTDYNMYYAPIKQGLEYIITAQNRIWGFFEDVPQQQSISYDGQRVLSSNFTFTAPITGYVCFRTNNTDTTPQCEYGSVATAYEPYNGTTVNISFGETLSGNGSLDVLSGILTRSDDTTKQLNANYIQTLNGLNNIWCDTGDTEVKYLLTLGRVS